MARRSGVPWEMLQPFRNEASLRLRRRDSIAALPGDRTCRNPGSREHGGAVPRPAASPWIEGLRRRPCPSRTSSRMTSPGVRTASKTSQRNELRRIGRKAEPTGDGVRLGLLHPLGRSLGVDQGHGRAFAHLGLVEPLLVQGVTIGQSGIAASSGRPAGDSPKRSRCGLSPAPHGAASGYASERPPSRRASRRATGSNLRGSGCDSGCCRQIRQPAPVRASASSRCRDTHPIARVWDGPRR